MKPTLQTRLSQQLTLTPQLQQAIRLLYLSTPDLVDEIQEHLANNPLLELCEENNSVSIDIPIIKETLPSIESSSWQSTRTGSTKADFDDDTTMDIKDTYDNSLKEHLLWQMRLTPMSEIDQHIAIAIIDAINADGYLACPLSDIAQSIDSDELDQDEITAVLHRIQQFDPVGVGARNLQEFLLIQFRHLDPHTPGLAEAETIINQHIDLLAQHDYKRLKSVCHFTQQQLTGTIHLIQSLNPRPCHGFSDHEPDYIIPDVVVRKHHDQWVVELNNEYTPNIQINKQYATLTRDNKYKHTTHALRDQLQQAQWLLKSIESRNETLLKVAMCIVEHQKAFLEHGEIAMQPLILQDIATLTELHESTISRITHQKYMQTPRGVYELKYFFSSHLHTTSGKECSSTAIRALIKKLVDGEPPSNPLSDNKIAMLLAQEGIHIARRTITKYRESLGIGSSGERRKAKQTI
jgi:RNA polymerase sigma-54 factor